MYIYFTANLTRAMYELSREGHCIRSLKIEPASWFMSRRETIAVFGICSDSCYGRSLYCRFCSVHVRASAIRVFVYIYMRVQLLGMTAILY